MNSVLLKNDLNVTQTFLPSYQEGSKAGYRTNTPDLPVAAQRRLTTVLDAPTAKGVHRASVKLEVPFLEVATGSNAEGLVAAPQVAHVVTFIVTEFASDRSTAEDRAHALRMMAHALVGANSTDSNFVLHPESSATGSMESYAALAPVTNLLVNLIPST